MKKLLFVLFCSAVTARASDPNPGVTASPYGRVLVRQADAASARSYLGVSGTPGVSFSTLPTTNSLSTNSGIAVDSFGSTHIDKTISYSNLLANSQVRKSINLTNQGSMVNGGELTNKLGNINLHAISGGTSSNRVQWLDSSGTIQGSIFWDTAHPNELHIDSLKSISLNMGLDAVNNAVLQLGSSTATHEIILDQYDIAVSSGATLGYSKYHVFATPMYYSGAAHSRCMGIRGEAVDASTLTSQLTIYGKCTGYSQGMDESGLNSPIGALGSTLLSYSAGQITNTLRVGTSPTAGESALSPVAAFLDVVSGGYPSVMFGADFNAATRTSGQNKYSIAGFAPVSSATLPDCFWYYSTAGRNVILAGKVVSIGAPGGGLAGLDGVEIATDSGNNFACGSANTIVNKGIDPNGGGIKHKRVTTGSITGSSSSLVTVTWGTAFADASYTVNASVLDSTSTGSGLSVIHLESVAAGSITVRVTNNTAGAITGTIHAIAMHD